MNRCAMVLGLAGALLVVFSSCGGPESATVGAVGPEDIRTAGPSGRGRCALCRRTWPTEVLRDRGKVEFRAGFWCKHKRGTVLMPVCGPCWSHMSHEQRAEFVQQMWEVTPPDWLNSEQRDAMLEEIRTGKSGGLVLELTDLPS